MRSGSLLPPVALLIGGLHVCLDAQFAHCRRPAWHARLYYRDQLLIVEHAANGIPFNFRGIHLRQCGFAGGRQDTHCACDVNVPDFCGLFSVPDNSSSDFDVLVLDVAGFL
jgi:hypothetical protein